MTFNFPSRAMTRNSFRRKKFAAVYASPSPNSELWVQPEPNGPGSFASGFPFATCRWLLRLALQSQFPETMGHVFAGIVLQPSSIHEKIGRPHLPRDAVAKLEFSALHSRC